MIKKKKKLTFLKEKKNKILSLLKNPLRNVWPHNDIQHTNTLKIEIGEEKEDKKERDSCLPKFIKIIVPTWMNKQLLKKAWVIKWKKEREGQEIPKQKNKKPIWERVLKAIIFLKSGSQREHIPATKDVNKPPAKRNNKK